jgi:hypothetical protein
MSNRAWPGATDWPFSTSTDTTVPLTSAYAAAVQHKQHHTACCQEQAVLLRYPSLSPLAQVQGWAASKARTHAHCLGMLPQ